MLFERILVLAAHPDDEVLGCGGTIARLMQMKKSVRVVFLAEGITARYTPDQFEDSRVQAEIKTRNQNAFIALDLMGVAKEEIFTHNRYCCRMDQVPLIEIGKEIEAHIRDFCPDTILTHAPDDTNIDHRIVHQATLTATRPMPGHHIKGLYAYEVLSSTEWNPLKPFAPTSFIDISETIDLKVRAMTAYGDEMRRPPHPRSPDVIRALAQYRGTQTGVPFAEGFITIRQMMG